MGDILHFREDDFAPPALINWRTWARMEISGSLAHKRAVAEGRAKVGEIDLASKLEGVDSKDAYDDTGIYAANTGDLRQDETTESGSRNLQARRFDAATTAKPPALTLLSDVTGSPSESRCSRSQLDNILTARDEREARRAAETVRP